MKLVGIDPGVSGGIAIVNGNKPSIYAFTDWGTMHKIIAAIKEEAISLPTLVALEHVHAMPGQGVSSTFTFGANYGGWCALLQGFEIPYLDVSPVKWQKAVLGSFPKGESKARALAYAQKMWPEFQFKKKDSGVVDALLLTQYLKVSKLADEPPPDGECCPVELE